MTTTTDDMTTTTDNMPSTTEGTTTDDTPSTTASATTPVSNPTSPAKTTRTGSSTTVPAIDLNDFVTDVTSVSRVRITTITPSDVSIAEFTASYARAINTIAGDNLLTERDVRVLELRAGSAIVAFASTVPADQTSLFYCASERARADKALLSTLQGINGVYAASQQTDDEVRYCTSCVAQDCSQVLTPAGSRGSGGSGGENNNAVVAIAVVAVLVVLALLAAFLYRRNKSSGSTGRREYIRGDLLEKEGGPAFSNPMFDAEPRGGPDRVAVNGMYANAVDLYSNYGGDAGSVADDPGYMDVGDGNDAYLLYGGPANSSTA
jgi:hypothetical protein